MDVANFISFRLLLELRTDPSKLRLQGLLGQGEGRISGAFACGGFGVRGSGEPEEAEKRRSGGFRARLGTTVPGAVARADLCSESWRRFVALL